MATALRPRPQCKQGKTGRLHIPCAVRKTVHVLPFQSEYRPGVNALRLSVTPPIHYLDMVLFPGGAGHNSAGKRGVHTAQEPTRIKR